MVISRIYSFLETVRITLINYSDIKICKVTTIISVLPSAILLVNYRNLSWNPNIFLSFSGQTSMIQW